MRGKNLTPDTRAKILSMRRNDRMRHREIAEALGIALSAVTAVIKRDADKIPVHVRASGRKSEAIRMMKEGVPSRDIAAALGIRRESVNALIKGEARPPGQASSSNRPKLAHLAERNARIVALHNEGKSSDWIASEFGIDRSCVCYVLRKNGIRQGTGNSNARKIAHAEWSALIAQWYNDGLSPSIIARRVHRSLKVINSTLRKAGIKQRKSRTDD